MSHYLVLAASARRTCVCVFFNIFFDNGSSYTRRGLIGGGRNILWIFCDFAILLVVVCCFFSGLMIRGASISITPIAAMTWLWGMRGTSPHQRYYTRCVASLMLLVQVGRILTAAQVVGSSGEEPWLAARILEIPVTVAISTSPAGPGLPTERHQKRGKRATSAGSDLATGRQQKIGRRAGCDRGHTLLCQQTLQKTSCNRRTNLCMFLYHGHASKSDRSKASVSSWIQHACFVIHPRDAYLVHCIHSRPRPPPVHTVWALKYPSGDIEQCSTP